jgi:hypothetical protein
MKSTGPSAMRRALVLAALALLAVAAPGDAHAAALNLAPRSAGRDQPRAVRAADHPVNRLLVAAARRARRARAPHGGAESEVEALHGRARARSTHDAGLLEAARAADAARRDPWARADGGARAARRRAQRRRSERRAMRSAVQSELDARAALEATRALARRGRDACSGERCEPARC